MTQTGGGYPRAVSAGEIVSIVVAVTALVVSGISLWLTVLRPAQFGLTYLSEHTEIAGGGVNQVPAMTEVRGLVALTNLGARAGLLERVEFGVPSVQPKAALRFAVDVQQREPATDYPMVKLDGQPLTWPKTIERGDVRSLEVNFGLSGDVRTERFTTGIEAADLKPLAELIAKLEGVSIPMHAIYRTGRHLFGQTRAICTLSIPGSHFRRAASAYWSEAGRTDLAEIVDTSFTGRNVDKP